MQVAGLDAAGLLAAMERIEALLDRVYRLEIFAQMLYVTDTNNPTFGALMQKLTEYAARVQQGLLFFELEWTALDDAAAAATWRSPNWRISVITWRPNGATSRICSASRRRSCWSRRR